MTCSGSPLSVVRRLSPLQMSMACAEGHFGPARQTPSSTMERLMIRVHPCFTCDKGTSACFLTLVARSTSLEHAHRFNKKRFAGLQAFFPVSRTASCLWHKWMVVQSPPKKPAQALDRCVGKDKSQEKRSSLDGAVTRRASECTLSKLRGGCFRKLRQEPQS